MIDLSRIDPKEWLIVLVYALVFAVAAFESRRKWDDLDYKRAWQRSHVIIAAFTGLIVMRYILADLGISSFWRDYPQRLGTAIFFLILVAGNAFVSHRAASRGERKIGEKHESEARGRAGTADEG